MGASFVDHLPLAETAAHIHGAATDRALCLGVVERPLYLSHCAECSWILETHDTSDGHLLSFFFFFFKYLSVWLGPVLVVVRRIFAASCGILCSLL